MRNWFARHPFTTFAIGIAGLGWLTWWEAARIETAQGTVAQGWGTGLAVGIAASLGYAAPAAAARARPVRTRARWRR